MHVLSNSIPRKLKEILVLVLQRLRVAQHHEHLLRIKIHHGRSINGGINRDLQKINTFFLFNQVLGKMFCYPLPTIMT